MMIRVAFFIAVSMLCKLANAGNEAWVTGANYKEGVLWAGTENSSGNAFGQYCYLESETCYYLISLDATCETDGTYETLVNADTGSQTAEMGCGWKTPDGRTVYIFQNFSEIDTIVRRASVIGIAIAMESGHFQVFRFNLKGSNAALDSMLTTANSIAATKKTPKALPAKEKI